MGTNIVGGVSPGKGGKEHLDRPVFDSVKEVSTSVRGLSQLCQLLTRRHWHPQAVRHLQPHATAVFVPPLLAADAILDAIENEVPLIVSVAEGIPLHDQMKVRYSMRESW